MVKYVHVSSTKAKGLEDKLFSIQVQFEQMVMVMFDVTVSLIHQSHVMNNLLSGNLI